MSTQSVAVNGKSGPVGMPETKQACRSLAKKRQDRGADRQPPRSVTRVLAAGLLALGIASAARADSAGTTPGTPPPLPQYAIVGLDIAPNSIDARPDSNAPNAINAAGVIAGTAGGQAALSDLTGTHPLDGVNASGLNAWGLNDLGQVLVRSGTGNSLYYGGAMRALGAVNGQDWWWWGVAINNAGQIVGTNGAYVGRNPPLSPVNVLWWYGTTTDMGNLIPAAINDAGQVAGSVPYDPNLIHTNMAGFTRRAAVWQGGTLKDLGVLPGDNASLATGINASGQIVGWSYRVFQGASNFNPHAFLYDGAAMHDLGTLGGLNGYGGAPGGYGGSVTDSDSEAVGINDAGQIVGWSNPLGPRPQFSFQETHAFLYSGGVMIDLNDLLPADAKQHWVLDSATAINNAGQIIGTGYYMKDGMTPTGGGVWRSFLLTFPDDPRVAPPAGPAPPPPAPLPLPAPPSGLAVKMASTTELDLTWTDNGTHEQAFEVQIADPGNPTLPWREAGTVSASTTTFASTGLTSDTHYTYRVRAWNPAGASDWSNETGGDTGVHPHADISPAGPLDFGTLPDGTPSAAETLTISNGGNGPLNIASITVTGANASEFALVPTATPLQSVAPGGSGSLRLVFTPAGAGPRSATLTIAHDAPGSPSTVALTGNGIAPIVRLSPTALDFGRQPVGLSGDLSLLLRNTGVGPLQVNRLAFQGPNAGDFSLATDGVTGQTLQPGDIVLLNIRFTPTMAGSRSASLAITDNAMDSPQLVSLTGIGTAPLLTLSADALVFGVQPASTMQTLILTNGGDAPLTVDAVGLAGPDAGRFQIVSDSGEKSLPVGASRTLTIGFTAATVASRSRQARIAAAHLAAVSYSAILEIHDNDPHPGAPHAVKLTALGAGGGPGDTPPAAPTNLAGVVTPAPQIALTWTVNSTNETALAIWRQTGNGAFVRVGVVVPQTTHFADAGMTPNTSYTYEVRAINNTGASPWSNQVTVVTPDVAPAAPTNLTATLTPANQVALTWVIHSDNETALAIWRQAGGVFVRVGVVVPHTLHFTDASVTPSTAYTYEVRAINNSGASPWSNTVSAVTLEAPPAAPTHLTATAAAGEIDLTWTRGGGNETGISIFRQTGGGAWQRIGVVVPSATGYADRSVQPGTSYAYQVRAHNSHYASAWTNVVSGVTLAVP